MPADIPSSPVNVAVIQTYCAETTEWEKNGAATARRVVPPMLAEQTTGRKDPAPHPASKKGRMHPTPAVEQDSKEAVHALPLADSVTQSTKIPRCRPPPLE